MDPKIVYFKEKKGKKETFWLSNGWLNIKSKLWVCPNTLWGK